MKQKPSERKKLRKVKPRQTRAQRVASSPIEHISACPCQMCQMHRAQALASSLNTKNLREPTPEELASQRAGWAKSCVTVDLTKAEDPNPWPRVKAWVKRVLGIKEKA